MLKKKRAVDMYRPSAYFLARTTTQGLGLAIGAALMDLNRATTLVYVTVMAFMLAGGYFVKALMKKFGAAVVTLEHRYYGKSRSSMKRAFISLC